MFLAILGISWFWFLGVIFLTQIPAFARDDLFAGESVGTLVIVTFTVAIGLGSVCTNWLLKGEVSVKYVPIAAILITVFAIDLFFATPHLRALAPAEGLMPIRTVLTSFAGWRAIVDLFIIAFCAGLFCVPLYALVQSKTPISRRARVIAANNIINAIFMTVATVLSFALIAAGLSIRTIFLLAGLANALAAAYICKLLPQELVAYLARLALPIALSRRGQGARAFS